MIYYYHNKKTYNNFKKEGFIMIVKNIKKGLYTNGEKLYTRECGVVVEFIPPREDSQLFLADGIRTARTFDYDFEVKKSENWSRIF